MQLKRPCRFRYCKVQTALFRAGDLDASSISDLLLGGHQDFRIDEEHCLYQKS